MLDSACYVVAHIHQLGLLCNPRNVCRGHCTHRHSPKGSFPGHFKKPQLLHSQVLKVLSTEKHMLLILHHTGVTQTAPLEAGALLGHAHVLSGGYMLPRAACCCLTALPPVIMDGLEGIPSMGSVHACMTSFSSLGRTTNCALKAALTQRMNITLGQTGSDSAVGANRE